MASLGIKSAPDQLKKRQFDSEFSPVSCSKNDFHKPRNRTEFRVELTLKKCYPNLNDTEEDPVTRYCDIKTEECSSLS